MRTSTARLAFVFFLIATTSLRAQSVAVPGVVDIRADEAAIRALATSRPAGVAADDAIFWSGAYARPLIGRPTPAHKPLPTAQMEQRRNSHTVFEPVRIEVASSGDLAYDFSNFELSYDLAGSGKHVAVAGSALTVWKKVNGQWRIAATFMRPYDDRP
jgi:ketosteroid isomerase-like protein